MAAGALRDKVGFYKRSATDDGYGNKRTDFSGSAEFTCAANIRPRLGGEDVLAARLAGKNLANITVRQSAASDAVTTEWLCKDERTGDVYNIRSIIDPEKSRSRRGMVWELLCEKGVAP